MMLLLEHGYQIEELTCRCITQSFLQNIIDNFQILLGPGNNGADGLFLGFKTRKLRKACYLLL